MSWRESSTGPASFGYYRGSPLARGSGSGIGQDMSGVGKFAQGQGGSGTSANSAWSPTILYMFVLVIVEMAIFGYLSRKV